MQVRYINFSAIMPARMTTSITMIMMRMSLLYSTFLFIARMMAPDLLRSSLAFSSRRWLRSSDSRCTSSSFIT